MIFSHAQPVIKGTRPRALPKSPQAGWPLQVIYAQESQRPGPVRLDSSGPRPRRGRGGPRAAGAGRPCLRGTGRSPGNVCCGLRPGRARRLLLLPAGLVLAVGEDLTERRAAVAEDLAGLSLLGIRAHGHAGTTVTDPHIWLALTLEFAHAVPSAAVDG